MHIICIVVGQNEKHYILVFIACIAAAKDGTQLNRSLWQYARMVFADIILLYVVRENVYFFQLLFCTRLANDE